MPLGSQVSPGMVISVDDDLYRVDSCVKVTMGKRPAVFKTKLRHLVTDDVLEKNFQPDQTIEEVFLQEKNLEYLYPEKKSIFF